MQEAAFGRINAPGCNCGCDFIPCHTSVNVLEAGRGLVAFELRVPRQLRSTPAIPPNAFDQSAYLWTMFSDEVVNRIARVARLWQHPDGVSNRLSSFAWACKLHTSRSAAQKNQASAALRNPVVSDIENPKFAGVTELRKLPEHTRHSSVSG